MPSAGSLSAFWKYRKDGTLNVREETKALDKAGSRVEEDGAKQPSLFYRG